MIALSCSQCGMKLKVKEQFAGRQSKCPTCKQPLVVPMPSATAAFVHPAQSEGGTHSGTVKQGQNSGDFDKCLVFAGENYARRESNSEPAD